ncbi:ribonuclease III [Coprobacter tertius]|uniref:ribonuclease III n=1 Tax=Coprobacter tertius TaxID=2944915 RepID=UPI003F4960B3
MFKTIYHKIRLFKLRHKEPYCNFYKILGFYPQNIDVYEQACLHRSSSIRTEKGQWINNERLEFLGDAVLDAIVADIVFNEFESKKEGFLTNTRSKIVQREMLNQIALKIGLDKLIIASTHTSSHNNYIYGNAFEAFIGAIYIDRGYEVCKKFIQEKVIKPYINLNQVAKKEVNFKSKLIEWCQKNKVDITFTLIESFTDHDNNPIFQFQVIIGGISGGIGIGYTKKESQQNAAQMALKKIKSDKDFLQAILDSQTAKDKEEKEIDTGDTEEQISTEKEIQIENTMEKEYIPN